MATFAKILEDKLVIPVVVRLGRGRFYDRFLYAYPDCLKWMKETVPTLETGRKKSAQTPAEQLILRLQQWVSGDPIKKGPMFKEMEYPRDNDVWELKTDDLRLFGWMYQPKKFIVASHGYADDYKVPTKTKDYADDVRAVMEARQALPLDGPKFVKGKFDDLV
ncbi:hypothetical protein [Nitrobacter sp. JJSN]|uniref:hypothetical protein n=1 Tax=Nitrobacter sp. JJSN TaxID=3453033 RepID=UPI003F75E087